ncbi:DUF1153 domain-containing protein [Novosphingobium tardum]|uniref:DUF1153 domain-containing protein n=1 Tax=Novosphingobium tardum TaxID=1538021 RepID=A0ABV8RJ61_9SPHN
MRKGIVVTGTDTGVGNTVFAAALAGAVGGEYWKPVQAGLEEETDSALVARLAGLPVDRILTLEALPEPSMTRWTIRRKAEVVAAVDGGLLTIDEALDRYKIDGFDPGILQRLQHQ